ncbi:hypothetical protein ACXPWS_12085 [Mycobacterium sp. BMJ-28]
MRTARRYLILGLVTATAPFAAVVAAPQALADCTYNNGVTVCAQGEARGADGVPRQATAGVPYPCEYDYYCGDDDWDIDVDWNPGRPGGPTIGGGPVIGGGRGGRR